SALPAIRCLRDRVGARRGQLVLVRPQAARDAAAARLHVGAELLRVLLAALLDVLHQRALLPTLFADFAPFVAAGVGQAALVLLQAAGDAAAAGLHAGAELPRVLFPGGEDPLPAIADRAALLL